MSTLRTRIKLGGVMFAAFFAVLFIDFLFSTDIGFGCIAILAAGMALNEFYNIARNSGFLPFHVAGIIAGIYLFTSHWITLRTGHGSDHNFFRPEVFIMFIFCLLVIQTFARNTKDAIKNISVTIFGVLYIPFLLSFANEIRNLPNGVCILIMVLLISKCGDIGGYLLGRKYGKHKLAESISPNKTIEGACFAILFSVLVSVIFSLIPQTRVMGFRWAVFFGLMVGFFAMLGDLAESLLKRDANVKDSGKLVPTFGGILDVIDCLLVSMPVAYYFLVFFQFV